MTAFVCGDCPRSWFGRIQPDLNVHSADELSMIGRSSGGSRRASPPAGPAVAAYAARALVPHEADLTRFLHARTVQLEAVGRGRGREELIDTLRPRLVGEVCTRDASKHRKYGGYDQHSFSHYLTFRASRRRRHHGGSRLTRPGIAYRTHDGGQARQLYVECRICQIYGSTACSFPHRQNSACYNSSYSLIMLR